MSNDSRRRRNRGSLPSVATVVTTAAVAYGTYRLANWAWSSWRRQDDDDDDENGVHQAVNEHSFGNSLVPQASQRANVARNRMRLRRYRLNRCREEAVNAVSDFLPTLKKTIEELTDTSTETKALKALRSNPDRQNCRQEERELWDAVKVKSITRMVATAKAHTMLFLILSVQVHLLGGRLFEEQMRTQTSTHSMGADSMASDRMTSYHSSHRLVLTRTYDFFFEKGIRLLVQSVERAVTDVMEAWDVTKSDSMNITKEAFEGALSRIKDIIEGRTRRSNRSRSIMRYLLPPDHAVGGNVSDELAQSILDETWDLLESPVFEDAYKECLSSTFETMMERGWSKLFARSGETNVEKPLAQVVTKLKNTSNSFYEQVEDELPPQRSSCNVYIAIAQNLPSILELGSVSFN